MIHDGFLAAILDAPDDDTPRLVFADWLEENGDGARAEFIRVQCELGSDPYRERICRETCKPPDFEGCPQRALRRRERELLDAHGLDWILPVARALGIPETPGRHKGNRYRHIGSKHCNFDETGRGIGFDWRRGFVAAVALTCADFLGGPCGRCGDRGRVDPPCGTCDGIGRVADPDSEYVDGTQDCPDCASEECPVCAGAGRTTGHAAALFAAAPIESVTLSDLEPAGPLAGAPAGGGWILHRADVPVVLWRLLDGGKASDLVALYPTAEAANADLSAACVKFGRALRRLSLWAARIGKDFDAALRLFGDVMNRLGNDLEKALEWYARAEGIDRAKEHRASAKAAQGERPRRRHPQRP